jgi:PEP-CTERM motif
MKVLFSTVATALLAASFCAAGPAKAAVLTGDSISVAYDFPTANSPDPGDASFTHTTFTVGSGIESMLILNGTDKIDIDFGANTLTFTFVGSQSRSSGAFNGPEFTVNSGAAFGAITSISDPDVSAALVGGKLEVNWEGDDFRRGETVVITFANAVPEPSTWAMMILGFLGVGFIAYRRRGQTSFAV